MIFNNAKEIVINEDLMQSQAAPSSEFSIDSIIEAGIKNRCVAGTDANA